MKANALEQAKNYILNGWDNGALDKRTRKIVVATQHGAGEKPPAAAAIGDAGFMRYVAPPEPPNV